MWCSNENVCFRKTTCNPLSGICETDQSFRLSEQEKQLAETLGLPTSTTLLDLRIPGDAKLRDVQAAPSFEWNPNKFINALEQVLTELIDKKEDPRSKLLIFNLHNIPKSRGGYVGDFHKNIAKLIVYFSSRYNIAITGYDKSVWDELNATASLDWYTLNVANFSTPTEQEEWKGKTLPPEQAKNLAILRCWRTMGWSSALAYMHFCDYGYEVGEFAACINKFGGQVQSTIYITTQSPRNNQIAALIPRTMILFPIERSPTEWKGTISSKSILFKLPDILNTNICSGNDTGCNFGFIVKSIVPLVLLSDPNATCMPTDYTWLVQFYQFQGKVALLLGNNEIISEETRLIMGSKMLKDWIGPLNGADELDNADFWWIMWFLIQITYHQATYPDSPYFPIGLINTDITPLYTLTLDSLPLEWQLALEGKDQQSFYLLDCAKDKLFKPTKRLFVVAEFYKRTNSFVPLVTFFLHTQFASKTYPIAKTSSFPNPNLGVSPDTFEIADLDFRRYTQRTLAMLKEQKAIRSCVISERRIAEREEELKMRQAIDYKSDLELYEKWVSILPDLPPPISGESNFFRSQLFTLVNQRGSTIPEFKSVSSTKDLDEAYNMIQEFEF